MMKKSILEYMILKFSYQGHNLTDKINFFDSCVSVKLMEMRRLQRSRFTLWTLIGDSRVRNSILPPPFTLQHHEGSARRRCLCVHLQWPDPCGEDVISDTRKGIPPK
eukprot:TRINITY_DN34367_c0_g1_i12.p1 TRINITY_DN34367_c0_g1~~TRINITY_DN34367_c0_g1_i12.p1  ORF type:complete len:107 (-),score=5.24 TRINITY_DN34367_c0_g1_i12:27-347(-)